MKKILVLLGFLISPSFVSSADLNPAVRMPDGSQQISINYRDRNTSPTTYAPTYNVESIFSYAHVTATTTVKSGAGFLHSVTFNKISTHTITLFDSATAAGTAIAVIAPAASTGPVTLPYNVAFPTGLTVGIPSDSGFTGWDLTVSYR